MTQTTDRTGASPAPAGRGAAGRELGRIKGINHFVLVTDDMEKTMQFYCGLLGLRVRATTAMDAPHPGALNTGGEVNRPFSRIYFLELPDGCLLTFVEVPYEDGLETVVHSTFDMIWPEEREGVPPARAGQKLDHLAFDVESAEDLHYLREKLEAAGYPCSPFQRLESSPFVSSIYTYDPNGVPIEFSSWDRGNTEWWQEIADRPWLCDPNPVPSMRPVEGR